MNELCQIYSHALNFESQVSFVFTECTVITTIPSPASYLSLARLLEVFAVLVNVTKHWKCSKALTHETPSINYINVLTKTSPH